MSSLLQMESNISRSFWSFFISHVADYRTFMFSFAYSKSLSFFVFILLLYSHNLGHELLM